jgi:hypothetical protein
MTKLNLIDTQMKVHDEMKAFYNAYEITGDEELLFIAQDLEKDYISLDIEISYL